MSKLKIVSNDCYLKTLSEIIIDISADVSCFRELVLYFFLHLRKIAKISLYVVL